jgi:hypothetical protein
MKRLTVLLIALLGVAFAGPALAAVQTDKYEYTAGETVYISGDGMLAGESLNIEVYLPDSTLDQSHEVVAAEDGTFSDTYVIGPEKPAGVYTVVATGLASGSVYTTTFDPSPICTSLGAPTLSSTSIPLGNSVTISGTLSLPSSGSGCVGGGTLGAHTVRLEVSFNGGPYANTGLTATTDSSGDVSFTYTPASAGTYVFRTHLVPGDSGNTGYREDNSADSDPLTVTAVSSATIGCSYTVDGGPTVYTTSSPASVSKGNHDYVVRCTIVVSGGTVTSVKAQGGLTVSKLSSKPTYGFDSDTCGNIASDTINVSKNANVFTTTAASLSAGSCTFAVHANGVNWTASGTQYLTGGISVVYVDNANVGQRSQAPEAPLAINVLP